jgi:thiamine biosynthesis lipoprotein
MRDDGSATHCNSRNLPSEAMAEHAYASRKAMATSFEVFLSGEDAEHLNTVAAAALDEVTRLEGVLSRFDPASEITRINREACDRPVRIDAEVWEVLQTCRDAYRRTQACFDVTAARGRTAAGDGLILDAEHRTVRLTRGAIDLGGFGKGYALDRAGEIVRRFGVTSGLLHGGTSSVVAIGRHPDGQGWPVAVRDPFDPDSAVADAQLRLADCALSCSSAQQPGQVTSDILDPRTGRPIDKAGACLVMADTAAAAEILSTVLLVMGKESARQYCEALTGPRVAVAWIDRAGPTTRLDWLREMT